MQAPAIEMPLKLILVWALTSGLSTGLGAYVTVRIFPEAGFAQQPVGGYSIASFAVACLIGVALGSAQYVVLRKIFLHYSRSVDEWLLSWIPATAIGVFIIIFPLYSFSAVDILKAPWLPALIMLPGAGVIGIGQWLVLQHYKIMGFAWVVRTAIGALLGACLGLIVALFIDVVFFEYFSIPDLFEPVWAGCVGLGLGLFQGDLISRKFTGLGAPPRLIIATIVILVLTLPIILYVYYVATAFIH